MSIGWLVLFLLLHRRRYPGPRDGIFASWRAQMRRPILGSLGFACGALVGLILAPTISLAVFVLIPRYYAVTSEGLRSTRHANSPDRLPR